MTLESADPYMRFCAEHVVHRISPRPLLLVNGAENRLHSRDQSRSVYEHAGDMVMVG